MRRRNSWRGAMCGALAISWSGITGVSCITEIRSMRTPDASCIAHRRVTDCGLREILPPATHHIRAASTISLYKPQRIADDAPTVEPDELIYEHSQYSEKAGAY